MDDSKFGIALIVGFVILAIATRGGIFKGGAATSTLPSEPIYNSSYTSPYQNYSGINPNLQNQLVDTNPSPFKNKVQITYMENPGTFNEYATLEANLSEGESVTITGWKIKSLVTGQEATIGGGALIPTVGVRDESPITLSANQTAVVVFGQSPIGTSFRVNKCEGFFAQETRFVPTLQTYTCPAVSVDAPPLSSTIDDRCLDYIRSLPVCTVFHDNDFPESSSRVSNACKNYLLTKVNYRSCVANHSNDPDFFKPEWRIYTGHVGIFWREKHETLELVDTVGRIVDIYSY